ncbi:hypothetical protein D3C71_1702590 [compost metagenome]
MITNLLRYPLSSFDNNKKLTIKWELLLLTAFLLPVLYIITRISSKQIYSSSKELSETSAEAQGEIYEDIAGLAEIKKKFGRSKGE